MRPIACQRLTPGYNARNMRTLAAVALVVLSWSASGHDVEPETVRDLLAIEARRPDEPGKSGADLITAVADRYVEIYRRASRLASPMLT